jgi:nicotinate-nucleotide adenylyltransferase
VKLGVMGGTFDPIHLGHLRAAERARSELGLERVVFVPARTPPHREPPVASAWDRFAMVALATAGHGAFVASEIELQRDGPSYTVDTIAVLREHAGEDPILIVGADSFAEMGGWKDAERLLALCSVAVVSRPGGPAGTAPGAETGRVRFVEGPALPISSTEIRRLVAERRSIYYLVPAAVAEYMDKRGLYR